MKLLLIGLRVLCAATTLSLCISASAYSVKITSPSAGAVLQQVDGVSDISVNVIAEVPPGGGVAIVLDKGTSNEESAFVLQPSEMSHKFPSVPVGEHTISVYGIDSPLGTPVDGYDSVKVGVGDVIVALGDENVEGLYDDIAVDNTSSDGRNGPVADPTTGVQCGGFEPILNDLLTKARGYPHTVINLGHAGDTSAKASAAVASALSKYPSASIWLLSYGENDAYAGVSSSTFKANMSNAIAQIRAAVPNPSIYISKVMYCTPSLALSYNKAIGDIERNTDNVKLGADLDTIFRGNASEYDRLSGQTGTLLAKTSAPHPNGLGCQMMAKLWALAILDNAYLVSDGVLASMGDVWADKIRLDGLDSIGLSKDNLLEVCEKYPQSPPSPPGTSFSGGGGWCVRIALTGAKQFAGGALNATVRVERDNLPPIGATSWNQMWLALDDMLLTTSRKQNTTSKNNYDLTATVSRPGQLSPVGDVTPPTTKCVTDPVSPDLANGWYSTIPSVTLSASDGTGQPASATYYHWDAGTDQAYSGVITGMSGTHTLYFHSVDQSQNSETEQSVVIKVDDEPRSVSISSPADKAIFQQVDGLADVPVTVSATNVPIGGGVQVIMDMGKEGEASQTILSSPYTCKFSSVPLGEHTLDAYMLNGTGLRMAEHNRKTQIGVGDIVVCIGDSITVGEVDDIYTDNWSSDGRNGPYIDEYSGIEYGGYEPILNDLLTAARGYPHSVINMGYAGDTSASGVSKIAGILTNYPTARTWLISYGTNDQSAGITKTMFKQNLLYMIGKIETSVPGALVYLPKVLYCTKTQVPDYERAIGDIVRNTDNVHFGADLNTLFRGNHSLFDHLTAKDGTWLATTVTHHPNGIGCQIMAKLWKLAIVDRAYLVSDGVMPTMGDLWADKIQLSGLDHLGLSIDNLLLLCEQQQSGNPPAGTSFGAGGWAVNLRLAGASDFSGGVPGVSIRIERDNLDPIGATSWDQMWIARDAFLMPTTRQQNATSRNNYNLTTKLDHPGQITGAGDVTAPVTTCVPNPAHGTNNDGSYSTAPTITLQASDSTGFPVAKTYYHWDSASDVLYTVALTAPTGTHVLHFHSVDQSGNVESDKTAGFTVKTIIPVSTLSAVRRSARR